MLSDLATKRVHSERTKSLISKALIGENNPFYNKTHSLETKIKIIEAKSAYPVYVYNSYRVLQVIFPSVTTLAKLINSNQPTIVKCIKNKALFRGDWYFSKILFKLSDVPLISNWFSTKALNLNLDLKNNSHIKKAIFVYLINKEFVKKFNGVMQAKKELHINSDVIKKMLY